MPEEIRELIRRMSTANPLWGSPRIIGELGKLGIVVAKSTVEKHMVRSGKPPSSTWRSFLESHVIVLNERHLKRMLKGYFGYYHRWRTHLSLDMDCPEPRPVQHPDPGQVVEIPEVNGLHHHYERCAA